MEANCFTASLLLVSESQFVESANWFVDTNLLWRIVPIALGQITSVGPGE